MLVAGTSCVDYSQLNNEQKTLDGGGESSQTFYGMYEWVKKVPNLPRPKPYPDLGAHREVRPPIVLLENVCTAPWVDMQHNFQEIGYEASRDWI